MNLDLHAQMKSVPAMLKERFSKPFVVENFYQDSNPVIQTVVILLQVICLLKLVATLYFCMRFFDLGFFAVPAFVLSWMMLLTEIVLIQIAVMGIQKRMEFAWLLAIGICFSSMYSYFFVVPLIMIYLLTRKEFTEAYFAKQN